MSKTIKKSVSMLLAVILVFSLFTIVPLSASAAVGDVLSEDDYLTFTAETAGASVTLNVAAGNNLQYDLNGTGLTGYTVGTPITLANAGDYVRFSGTGTKFSSSKHFSITGKVACSGNVMSLRLNGGTGLTTAPDLFETDLKAGCYSYMFNGCTSLTTAPTLPATALADNCYERMFYGCTSLTTAPELPATTLAESCYSYMFSGCTSLTTAPELWATSLAVSCYNYMFSGCTSLTTAPELPATTLANYCYQNMFRGCTKLTEAPELPATTLASYCYSNMFRDCQSLTEAPELPATNLAQYCYNSMFYGCTKLTELPALPATTLAVSCYNYMFYGCTSLTELPALPATTLQSSCYYGMFYYCSKICISDEAGTFDGIKYSVEYRIPTTGEGTSASGALTNMFANTGGKFKGTPNINTIYYVPAPTHTITWKLDANTEIDTTEVVDGVVPTHDAPSKAADSYYTYTFAGWNDGETTYAPNELPAATADVTYTAQFTSEARTFMVFVKKLTGGTINVYDVSCETTVAQLKDILASQTGAPASAQRLIFAGKQLENDKQLSEYNIQKESTIHLIISTYTVTWKNWNDDELYVDTTVPAGETPTYPYENPTRPEDDDNTYTFSNWDPDVQPVTGPAEYKATYTAVPKPKKLIVGHSLTLDGNIGVNFYLDPAAAGLTADQVTADNLSYTFAWANGNALVNVAAQSGNTFAVEGDYIKVTCKVCAAEMTCGVNASFTLGDKSESEVYSVRAYYDEAYNATEEQINTVFGGADKYDALVDLMNKMLDYGAKAQTVFGIKTGDLANDGLDYVMQAVAPDDFVNAIKAANEGAENDVAANLPASAGFKTASLVFLSENTLRLYFEKKTDAFSTAGLTKWNDYYYTQVTDIPAAELDNLQAFSVSGATLHYSALDYAKELSANANADNAALGQATYWYNQAANAYFD